MWKAPIQLGTAVDRLKRFFTEPTPRIPPGGQRSFRVFNVATVAALGVHAIVSGLFLALGVPLEARGVVQVKGKGPMETWLLRGGGEGAPAPC